MTGSSTTHTSTTQRKQLQITNPNQQFQHVNKKQSHVIQTPSASSFQSRGRHVEYQSHLSMTLCNPIAARHAIWVIHGLTTNHLSSFALLLPNTKHKPNYVRQQNLTEIKVEIKKTAFAFFSHGHGCFRNREYSVTSGWSSAALFATNELVARQRPPLSL